MRHRAERSATDLERRKARAATRAQLDALAGRAPRQPAPVLLRSRRMVEVFVGLSLTPAPQEFGTPVIVSTARRPGKPPVPKLGRMVSKSLRRWVKTEATCAHAGCKRKARELDHYPTTGANGTRCDLLATATCRKHHDLRHAGKLSDGAIEKAIHATWVTLARLYPDLLRTILAELTIGS